jgi:YidC/Oxa1 family membrane protein insertase
VRLFSLEVTSVFAGVQQALVTFQHISQLDWWATLGLSTVVIRLAVLPLVRKQIIASRKLALAMPEINFLFQLLHQRLSSPAVTTAKDYQKVVNVFFKGASACLVLHEVRLGELLLYPLLNLTIFVTFVTAVRDLVLHGPVELNLDYGGMLWFKDLTDKDATFMLPITALSLSYLNLDMAMNSNSKSKFLLLLRDTFQCLVLLSIPAAAALPTGVFCYWIPNSAFALLQTIALRDMRMQQLLRLPLPPSPKR